MVKGMVFTLTLVYVNTNYFKFIQGTVKQTLNI